VGPSYLRLILAEIPGSAQAELCCWSGPRDLGGGRPSQSSRKPGPVRHGATAVAVAGCRTGRGDWMRAPRGPFPDWLARPSLRPNSGPHDAPGAPRMAEGPRKVLASL